MGSFSIWHWLIVLVVVVLIFGTKKLRNLGTDLGGAVKGFKDGMKTEDDKTQAGTGDRAPWSTARGKTIEGEVKDKSQSDELLETRRSSAVLDFSVSELVVIGVVALVVIGPERLPRVARTAGHLLGRFQRYVADVKSDINREIELAELKKLRLCRGCRARRSSTTVKTQV